MGVQAPGESRSERKEASGIVGEGCRAHELPVQHASCAGRAGQGGLGRVLNWVNNGLGWFWVVWRDLVSVSEGLVAEEDVVPMNFHCSMRVVRDELAKVG